MANMSDLPKPVQIMFCDHTALLEDSKRSCLVGIFDRIFSQKFPFTRWVSVVAWFSEFSPGKYDFFLEISDPKGSVTKNPKTVHIEVKQGEEPAANVRFWQQLVFHKPGKYTFSIKCLGKLVAQRKLSVLWPPDEARK